MISVVLYVCRVFCGLEGKVGWLVMCALRACDVCSVWGYCGWCVLIGVGFLRVCALCVLWLFGCFCLSLIRTSKARNVKQASNSRYECV